MRKAFLLFATSLLANESSAWAQTPPAPATVPSKSPIQQQFDDGAAAMGRGEWQRAFDIYASLEATLAARSPLSKSLNIVRLRKGQMLYRLGNQEEGEATILAALAKLDQKDPNLVLDRFEAYLTLAIVDERRFDYVAAINKLNTALAISTDDFDKIRVYSQLIPIRIFVDVNEALADADKALAIIAANPKADKEWLGVIRGLRGRTLTNLGRLKEARADLRIAVSRLGGLNASKINLLDAAARSDSSIAAMRDDDPEDGRLLLAYTGSAQASEEGFRLGVNMDPPACGGVDGPKPEDVAVVEFSISADGRVNHVVPVFYSGDLPVAIQFAKAVSEWYWDAETLKGVKPFFRALTRLELRCTTKFKRSNIFELLQPTVDGWLSSINPDDTRLSSIKNDEQGLKQLNEIMLKLAQKDGADNLRMARPLLKLSRHRLMPFELSKNYSKRAYNIVKNANAPAPVQAYFAYLATAYVDNNIYRKSLSEFQRAVQELIADPKIATDASAVAALRIALFDSYDADARVKFGEQLLAPVKDDARLVANDPFKVAALTRLANVSLNSGKLGDARSLFAQTGLSAQQCALVDAKPVQTGGSIGSDNYPNEAIALGLGGWTVVEFDIDPDGRTQNRRPVISWPPFIFGQSAVRGVAAFRFQQTFRPEGGLGCGGQQQRIAYVVPK